MFELGGATSILLRHNTSSTIWNHVVSISEIQVSNNKVEMLVSNMLSNVNISSLENLVTLRIF